MDDLIINPIPQKAYLYFPTIREIIEFDENNPNKTWRKIFEGGVDYNYYEKLKLKELKFKIVKYDSNRNLFEDSQLLRFLQSTHYNIDKTIEIILQNLKLNFKINISEDILEILNSGFIYIHGRDNRFRPIIIINTNVYFKNKNKFKFDDWNSSVIYLLECVINHLLIPGQIENYDIICDMENVSINNDIKKLFYTLQNYSPCRIYSIILINIPNLSWSNVKSFIDINNVRKIKLLKKDNLDEIFIFINKNQIELKFGGLAKNLKDNYFNNNNNNFPNNFPSDDYFLKEDYNILLDEEEYKNMININKEMIISPYLKTENKINNNTKYTGGIFSTELSNQSNNNIFDIDDYVEKEREMSQISGNRISSKNLIIYYNI